MSEIIVPARGCIYVTRKGTATGFYSLQPQLRSDNGDSHVLIQGADITLSDITFPVATLDKKKYFYVMGDDFGNVGINGLILLGKSDSGGYAFGEMDSYFNSYRSAIYKKPISISCPGQVTHKFFLTSLLVTKTDPELNLQFFQMRGLIIEPKTA